MERLEDTLSMEQKLSHRIFSDRVDQLSLDEAKELLVQMHKQMLYKDNIYKQLFLSQERDMVNAVLGGNNN